MPRRRWSAEAKARLVAEAMAPDANVSAIARRNGMSPAQLFGWRRRALQHRTEHEGTMVDADTVTGNPATVEIVIAGVVVRAGADIGEEALKRVIRAVRSA